MINNSHQFLFRDVSEEDYSFLKAREPSIIGEVRRDLRYGEGATDKELAYFNANKPSFGYNARRQVLGIFLKEDRRKRLIVSREDFNLMSDIEKKIFLAMRKRLEENLEGIKLKKEDWK